VNVSDGYIALAEIQKRFGKGVDPRKAFEAIDAMSEGLHQANHGLRLMLVAVAFDYGMLLGALERVEGEPSCGDPLWELRDWLALPNALEVRLPEKPEPPRIIAPPTH
jgi:hypothetical protein